MKNIDNGDLLRALAREVVDTNGPFVLEQVVGATLSRMDVPRGYGYGLYLRVQLFGWIKVLRAPVRDGSCSLTPDLKDRLALFLQVTAHDLHKNTRRRRHFIF